jgi:hypothetical protein
LGENKFFKNPEMLSISGFFYAEIEYFWAVFD